MDWGGRGVYVYICVLRGLGGRWGAKYEWVFIGVVVVVVIRREG